MANIGSTRKKPQFTGETGSFSKDIWAADVDQQRLEELMKRLNGRPEWIELKSKFTSDTYNQIPDLVYKALLIINAEGNSRTDDTVNAIIKLAPNKFTWQQIDTAIHQLAGETPPRVRIETASYENRDGKHEYPIGYFSTMQNGSNATPAVVQPKAMPFIGTDLQRSILEQLQGNALPLESLATTLGMTVSTVRSAIYGPNGLKTLGHVANKRGLGYYRPGAPPDDDGKTE